jgi:hypothetical protein
MRARLLLLLLPAVLAGCSSQKAKELEAVKSARSTIAEWALVEELAVGGRAQATYVEQMRQLAKHTLDADRKALAGQPAAAGLISQLRSGSPGPGRLKQADSALEPLEKRLEAS